MRIHHGIRNCMNSLHDYVPLTSAMTVFDVLSSLYIGLHANMYCQHGL